MTKKDRLLWRAFDALDNTFDRIERAAFDVGHKLRELKHRAGQAMYSIPIIGPARERWALERARRARQFGIYLNGLYMRDVQ